MPNDNETLRAVYQAELDALKPLLRNALDERTERDLALIEAQRRYANAVTRHATLQGRMDALRDLAAREGVRLD